MSVLRYVIPKTPSKVERSKALYPTYSLFDDCGDSFVKNGITMTKRTNGYSRRYVPNGLIFSSTATTVNDSILNTYQTMFTVTIPAGTLHEGDSISITYGLSGSSTNYNHRISIASNPVFAGVHGTWIKNNATLGTTTLTITARDSDLLYLSFTNNVFLQNSNVAEMTNTLNDIVLTFATNFTGTTSGRTQTVGTVTRTYTPATTSVIADTTSYRLPDLHPFRNNSPWNIPLDHSILTWESPTDPMTSVARDKYAGLKVKSGTASVVHWANVYSDGAVPVHYIQDSDQEQTWLITTLNASPGMRQHMPSPFSFRRSGSRIFKFKCPVGPIPSGQSSDKAFALITQDKRYAIEVGAYSYNATTKVHSGMVYVIDLFGYGFSQKYTNGSKSFFTTTAATTNLSSDAYGFQAGFRAGGFPLLGGLIRGWELTAGTIDHMIQMQLANTQLRSTVFTVVSASGTTFVIKPRNSAVTEGDYTSIFPAGVTVRHNATNYTTTGTPTFDPVTNQTTITVTSTISTSSTILYRGFDGTIGFDTQYVWPAAERDGTANNTVGGYDLTIPMGQVFGIPNTVDLNTLGLTPEGLVVATAIQKYGAIVGDIAGNTFAYCQADGTLTTTQRANLVADATKIISQLVAITNYTPANVLATYNNVAITKPKPLLPLYNTGVS